MYFFRCPLVLVSVAKHFLYLFVGLEVWTHQSTFNLYWLHICKYQHTGASADWWSVGVILFELIVGIPPFNAEHPQVIYLALSSI
jgi:serine/threonine protein kinase